MSDDEIRVGPGVTIGFERTLRVPDDGRAYPVPPALDILPVYRVEDYSRTVPAAWRQRGGAFIPLFQREALWLTFSGRWWKPNAVTVAIDGVNAITGRPRGGALSNTPQDYLVIPDQPWLNGAKSSDGRIRQFTAPALDPASATAAASIEGMPRTTLQLAVFEAKSGRFPDEPSKPKYFLEDGSCRVAPPEWVNGAYFAAARDATPKPLPDTHGVETWDSGNCGSVYVYLVNIAMFRRIAGAQPPPTPITAAHYAEYGLPWSNAYEEGDGAPGSRHEKA